MPLGPTSVPAAALIVGGGAALALALAFESTCFSPAATTTPSVFSSRRRAAMASRRHRTPLPILGRNKWGGEGRRARARRSARADAVAVFLDADFPLAAGELVGAARLPDARRGRPAACAGWASASVGRRPPWRPRASVVEAVRRGACLAPGARGRGRRRPRARDAFVAAVFGAALLVGESSLVAIAARRGFSQFSAAGRIVVF